MPEPEFSFLLEKYLKMIAQLNRAPGPIWTDTTLKRAPHKPILLLAVIDLVSRGVFKSSVLSAQRTLLGVDFCRW